MSAQVVRLVIGEIHAYSPIAGDAMVRELDISRITLRLMEKEDKKGGDDEHVFAKLSGDTLSILQQCLVRISSIWSSERCSLQVVQINRFDNQGLGRVRQPGQSLSQVPPNQDATRPE